MSKEKQPRMEEVKYKDGCPFCKCAETKRTIKDKFDSDFYCVDCQATFQSLHLDDKELRGLWTGKFRTNPSKEFLYKNGFHNEFDTIEGEKD